MKTKDANDSLIGCGIGTVFVIIFFLGCLAEYVCHRGSLGWVILFAFLLIYCIYGLITTLKQKKLVENQNIRQEEFGKNLQYDTRYGDEEKVMYYNKSQKRITLTSSNSEKTEQIVIDNFELTHEFEIQSELVAVDMNGCRVINVTGADGVIEHKVYDLKEKLEREGFDGKLSNSNVKQFNDYVFITNDAEGFLFIIKPDDIELLRYTDIVSISYEENGNDVFNKSLGGAVVGGMLFGGVGAVVGSNVSEAKQKKEIKKMSIKILLKSTSKSTLILKIFEAAKDSEIIKTKLDSDLKKYEELMAGVNGIKDIFSIIMDMVDKGKSFTTNNPVMPVSIADELAKLAKLRDAGILTEEEFAAQKAKLIG